MVSYNNQASSFGTLPVSFDFYIKVIINSGEQSEWVSMPAATGGVFTFTVAEQTLSVAPPTVCPFNTIVYPSSLVTSTFEFTRDGLTRPYWYMGAFETDTGCPIVGYRVYNSDYSDAL